MRNLEKDFFLDYLLLGIIWFRRKLEKTPRKLNDYLCRMILIATVWRCHRNIYWSCWHTLEFVGVLNYSGVKTRRRHQGCLYWNCDHLFLEENVKYSNGKGNQHLLHGMSIIFCTKYLFVTTFPYRWIMDFVSAS